MKTLSLLFLALLTLPSARAEAVSADWDSSWTKTSQENGITLYEKNIPGSSLMAFGGDGVIDEPLAKVASVLLDAPRATEWVSDLELSKIIGWVNPTTFIEYDHVGTPIVMRDRDFLSLISIQVGDGGKRMALSYKTERQSDIPPSFSTSDLPPPDRYIRGDVSGTRFVLTSTDDGAKTAIHAEIHADPKGSVAQWIVNLFQRGWPVKTFNSLRNQLKKPDIRVNQKVVQLLSGGEPTSTADSSSLIDSVHATQSQAERRTQ